MENTSSLTQGRVLSTLIKFALPVFAAMFLQSLYGGVDLLVVGQFATTADISGVATGTLVVQTVTMVIVGLSMGVTVYVGRKIGKGQRDAAGRAIGAAVRVPVVLLVSRIPNASLFMIGLATPASTFVQIVLCLAFFRYCQKRNRQNI